MALNFTFLTIDQIWGDRALDVIKQRKGKNCDATDLTAILGGNVGGSRFHASRCSVFTASANKYGDVEILSNGLDGGWVHPEESRGISARPALSPWGESKIKPTKTRTEEGIQVVEYGEYPQTVADDCTSKKLEELHSSSSLPSTGKTYTFDSEVGSADYQPYKPKSYPEYEMDGKRYIRILGSPYDIYSFVESEKPYWVQVEPIEWLVDKTGWIVSKKCLFAGVPFDTGGRYHDNFSTTIMGRYLNNHFAKEIADPVARSISLKKANKNRKGLVTLLDALNKLPPTPERKAAKVAAVKTYRKTNPKDKDSR
jgi:hypothetical protein